jgi:hypothetical protein
VRGCEDEARDNAEDETKMAAADKSVFLRVGKTQLSAKMVQISTGGYTKSKRLAEKENCLPSFSKKWYCSSYSLYTNAQLRSVRMSTCVCRVYLSGVNLYVS